MHLAHRSAVERIPAHIVQPAFRQAADTELRRHPIGKTYGIALLLSTMLNRDLTVYFLLGFFFVGYLGLDVTAVAIFAAILAVILTGLKYGKGAPAAAAAGAAAANPDYDPLEDDDDL